LVTKMSSIYDASTVKKTIEGIILWFVKFYYISLIKLNYYLCNILIRFLNYFLVRPVDVHRAVAKKSHAKSPENTTIGNIILIVIIIFIILLLIF
jgi:hypothetical protein